MDIGPISRVDVGALGEPGSRRFLLQAKNPLGTITLLLEKGDVAALAKGSYELLLQMGREDLAQKVVQAIQGSETDAALVDEEPIWRVGALELTFEEATDRIVLTCERSWFGEEADPEGEPAQQMMIPLTPDQLATISAQSFMAVSAGRPICPLCSLPMEPDGHVCPATNGHHSHVFES